MDNINMHEAKIINIIKKVIEYDGYIETNTRLQEIGINSISIIQILFEIEKEFDFEISDDNLDYTNYNCVNDIVDMVKGCTVA